MPRHSRHLWQSAIVFRPPICDGAQEKENEADKIPDGTVHSGARSTAAQNLLTVDVLEIRRRYAAGGTSQRKLAAEYGVSQEQIFDIIHRRRWAYLNDDGTWN